MEGEAGHRDGRQQLVDGFGWRAGRGEGAKAVFGHRREKRHVGAQGPYADGQSRGVGRGADCADHLLSRGRATEARRCAHRRARSCAGVGLYGGRGRGETRAAPLCRRALSRFSFVRWAENPCRARQCSHEREIPAPAARPQALLPGCAEIYGPEREVDKTLQGHSGEPEALSTQFGLLGLLARIALTAAFAVLLGLGARAQPVTTAITGHIAGPDRTQRLIEGARKEGVVTVYSSITLETMTLLTAAFEKKYAIKVELWRGGAGDILQRLTTESRGGRNAADVVEGAGPDIAPLARENLLQEVASPVFAELMPGAVVPGRPWVGSRLSIFVAAYNTNAFKPSDLPKSYDDLLNPHWKGRIGIEANDSDWLMAMADAMGEARATKLFGD